MSEDFRTLYCDPGEDFGWAVGRHTRLLAGGTEKMWVTADEMWEALSNPSDPHASIFNGDAYARDGVTAEDNTGPIGRVVCEDWRLYPEKLKFLKWDQCRTARVIGAITFLCRHFEIPLVLQPAAIKKAAQAAGAEELYYKPLKENRHQNDAIQHFVFYTQTELLGLKAGIDLKTLPGAPSAVA